eukprot:Clim_evm38s146 gene=Clim_evmTU38s146
MKGNVLDPGSKSAQESRNEREFQQNVAFVYIGGALTTLRVVLLVFNIVRTFEVDSPFDFVEAWDLSITLAILAGMESGIKKWSRLSGAILFTSYISFIAHAIFAIETRAQRLVAA